MSISNKHSNSPSVTPSTQKLIQLREGKGLGMLTDEEIELLRQSKKEISDVCQAIFKSMDLKG